MTRRRAPARSDLAAGPRAGRAPVAGGAGPGTASVGAVSEGVVSAALLGLAFLFALRVAATFFPTSWLWGLDSLADRNPAWKVAGLALFALAFWRRAAMSVGSALERLAGLSWLPRLAVALLAAVPFYLARSLNLLLGDTQLNVRALTKKIELSGTAQREPGAFTAVSWFHQRVGAPLDLTANTSFAIVSVAFGVLYVFVALTFARAASRHASGRALIAAGTLALGALGVFFGYPENYFFVNALGLLYLLLAWRAMDGRCSLVVPAAALGVSVFVHTMVAFLVPSFVYLLWVEFRSGRRARAFIAAGAALATLALLLVAIRYPFGELLRVSREEDHFLPPLSRGARSPAYALYSWVHFTELANAALLAAPCLLALGFALAARRRGADASREGAGQRAFSFVAAGGFVLFALIANPILGMSRDWDVLTFAFALFSVVAVVRLAAAPLAPASFRRIAGALAITGFVHLGLWAALNRSPDLSRRRFERIATNERLFGAVWNAELWRYLGSASAQAGAYVPARDAFVQAIRRNPAEPMTYRLLAEIEYARGLHHSRKTGSPLQVSLRAALGDYYRMVLPIARKPSFVYLGAAYAGVQISGADSLVIDAFRNAVKEDPEDLEARAAWGDVLRNHGQIDEAEAEYAAVLAKQEGHVRAMMGMILVSGARGAPREEITRRVEDLRRRYPWSTCVQHMQNLLWQPRGLDGPQGFRGFLCFK